jgi:TP901 family phage tail tape measure protein
MADLALSYASIGAQAMIAELDRVASHAEAMAASVTAAARDVSGARGIPAIPKAVDKLPAAAGSIDAFNDELKKLREQFNATGSAIERAHIGPQIAALEQQVASAEQSIPKATKSMGASIKDFASQYAAAFGAAAVATVVAFGKESVAAFMDYETAMADLSAITGAAGDELAGLGEQAKSMGIGIEGGAVAAVEGFKIVKSAMADLTSKEVTAITKDAITFAQAAGMAVPEATRSLAAAMNQMEAEAKDSGKFINVLGAAAKFGASEIPFMTEALLQFGGVAASAKFSIEESAAAIQTLAKFGIESGEAGTKLRNIGLAMTNIKGLPKEAVDGMKAMQINMDLISDSSVPVVDRLKEFRKVLDDGVVAEKVFGKENIIAAQRLLENIPLFEQLTEQVTGTNVAYEQAAVNNATLAHSFLEIKNQIGVFMIEIGEAIAPVIREITQGFTPAFEMLKKAFIAIYTPMGQIIQSIGEIAEALGLGGSEGNAFVGVVEVLTVAIRVAFFPFQALTTIISGLLDAIQWGITAFQDARDAVHSFTDRIPFATEALDVMIGTISRMLMPLLLVKDAWDAVFGGEAETTQAQKTFIAIRTEAFKVAEQMGATQDQIIDFSKNLVAAQYAGLSMADAAAKLKMDFAAYLQAQKDANDAAVDGKRVSDDLAASIGGVGVAAKDTKKAVEELGFGYAGMAEPFLLDAAFKQLKVEQDKAAAIKETADAAQDLLDVYAMSAAAGEDPIVTAMVAAVPKVNEAAEALKAVFLDLKESVGNYMLQMAQDVAFNIGQAIGSGASISEVFKSALREMLVTVPKMVGIAMINQAATVPSPASLPLAIAGLALIGASGLASGIFKKKDAERAALQTPSTASTTSAMPTPNRSGLEAYNGSDSQQPVAIYFDGPEGEKFTAWMTKKQIRQQGRRG